MLYSNFRVQILAKDTAMLHFRPTFNIPSIPLPTHVKITVISFSVGITLLGFLARLLGRRRKRKRALPTYRPNPLVNRKSKQEIPHLRSSASPSFVRHHRHGSVGSDRQSIVSGLTTTLTPDIGAPPASLTPQELGTMGMEALETAIGYWEDALASYRPVFGERLALTDADENKFTHLLEVILDQAYKLQERCSHLFLYESSILFQTESVVSSRYDRESDRRTMTSMSSADSFVSAQAEIADINEFDEFTDLSIDVKDLALYQEAVKKYEQGAIACRILRTDILKCQSTMEYLSKLHCVRIAFGQILEQDGMQKWFTDVGTHLLTNLMLSGEKDPKDCLAAYENILRFVEDRNNWPIMEDELQSRGVRCLSFYDVVFDFILLDAFEDLENPPSSVTAVVQNRWLSSGFKETALATAVWSVLKAKRRMLKHQDGFICHFYAISEHLIPVLAWGFLGPNEELKEICNAFKDEVMGFMQDIFNFNVVRYTTADDLTSDILDIVKERYERTCQKISFE